MSDELYHYGTPRHSGRYPWGSGKNPQRHKNIYTRYNEMRKKYPDLTEAQIAKGFGMSTTELRAKLSIATNEIKKENINRARSLNEKGYKPATIAKMMSVPDSTVRSWLKPDALDKKDAVGQVAETLKKNLESKGGYIDISTGAELSLNTTDTKLKTAVAMLQEEGYKKINVQVDQLGTVAGQKTTIKVLAPPGTTYQDVKNNKDQIRTLEEYSSDTKREISKLGLPPVNSVSSDRIKIIYDEDGGTQKDGVIELRRGVEDLNLGNAKYAQVRIGVDGTHYLKGMAMYSDNMPPGVDIIFNTNKSKGTPLEKVLKEMKTIERDGKKIVDPDNPFGASIRSEDELKRVPRYYTDKNGKEHVSPINVVNEEGDWGNWSRTLASQFLAKQPLQLVKKQLNLSYDIKKSEFDEIMSLTNPVVKKTLLQSFANDCDASAVHLKAAALPRQAAKVILPVPSLKENEIYAPHLHDGDTVALVRFPHGGTFEIPVLTVNNRNKNALSVIGNATDAVGIHPKAAEQLSGADFDGDTALVIPTGDKVKVQAKRPLKDLVGFDPKKEYKIDRSDPEQDKIKKMTARNKQIQMGVVSNLITDMTIKGATEDELARAVKHSMVVIDSEKHDLDYRRSERENGIKELKKKYQIQEDGTVGGASTIFSRAKNTIRVERRKEISPDPETGERRFEKIENDTYKDPTTGKIKTRTEEVRQMDYYRDANTLVSTFREPRELEYAAYANKLKDLGNKARKAAMDTPKLEYSPSAAKTYATEVQSLDHKLREAQKNAPRERQAQLLGNKIVAMKLEDNPSADKDTIKKWKGQALATARTRVGAKKERVDFTPREWEAVQAGAISSTKLSKLLSNSDMDKVKKLATPRATKEVTSAKRALAKSMDARGYTLAEIADRLGVSSTTVSNILA